ncbi:MAG: 16S rRNA (guanine(966)-N(2))-methyltransferase RsmD [Spirochaetia bacterium]|jgi:16S rRNA (guanine(966)-N(2))-methyltransferase RsmD|nr:16S rRNA (guanine(966)-N(2))-methyltransferase RsmD [Spirochaetia bacterium]
MRITGGKYCSRQIKCPKGVIRPAMDRMRESMFSILGNIDDLSFLDLFCGSGIVGLEAASRGASPVCFVEMDRIKKHVLRENVKIAENTETKIFIMSAERFISTAKEKFDLVFLDPPFPLKNKVRLAELACEKDIINANGLLMIHHPSEENWPERIGDLLLKDRRKYGRSILLFYQKQNIV